MYAGFQGSPTPTPATAPPGTHAPHYAGFHGGSAPTSTTPGSETWTPEQVWHFLRDHGFDEQTCSSFLTRRIDGKQFARLSLVDLVPPLFLGDALVRDRLYALIQQLAQGYVPYPPMMAQPIPMMMPPQFAPSQMQQVPLFQVAPIPDEFDERNSWGHLFISRTSGHFIPNMKAMRYMIIPIVVAIMIIVIVVNAITTGSVFMVIIPIVFVVIFLGITIKRLMGLYTFWFESRKFRAKNLFSQIFEVNGSEIDSIYACEMKTHSKHRTYIIGYKIRIRLKNGAMQYGDHLDVEMPIAMPDRAILMARALAGLLGAPFSDGIH